MTKGDVKRYKEVRAKVRSHGISSLTEDEYFIFRGCYRVRQNLDERTNTSTQKDGGQDGKR